MHLLNRQSASRWLAAFILVGLVASAACSQSSDPLASTDASGPTFEHAAGTGFIGPADKAPSGLAKPPAEGGGVEPAASPAPAAASPEAAPAG